MTTEGAKSRVARRNQHVPQFIRSPSRTRPVWPTTKHSRAWNPVISDIISSRKTEGASSRKKISLIVARSWTWERWCVGVFYIRMLYRIYSWVVYVPLPSLRLFLSLSCPSTCLPGISYAGVVVPITFSLALSCVLSGTYTVRQMTYEYAATWFMTYGLGICLTYILMIPYLYTYEYVLLIHMSYGITYAYAYVRCIFRTFYIHHDTCLCLWPMYVICLWLCPMYIPRMPRTYLCRVYSFAACVVSLLSVSSSVSLSLSHVLPDISYTITPLGNHSCKDI